jgi:hypothetical protein
MLSCTGSRSATLGATVEAAVDRPADDRWTRRLRMERRIRVVRTGGQLRLVRSRLVHAFLLAGVLVGYGFLGGIALLAGLVLLWTSPILFGYFTSRPAAAGGPLPSGLALVPTFGVAVLFLVIALTFVPKVWRHARIVVGGEVLILDRDANALRRNRRQLAPLDQVVAVRVTEQRHASDDFHWATYRLALVLRGGGSVELDESRGRRATLDLAAEVAGYLGVDQRFVPAG